MGRITKTFRQTKKAGSADRSAKNYARINRNSWQMKSQAIIKIRGKGGY